MKYGTLIKFDIVEDDYRPGLGNTEEKKRFKVKVNSNFETDCLYCEWANNYGSLALTQQQQGIIEGARIRMPFIKSLLDIMRSNKKVIIYRGGKEEPINTFELATSVDNIKENNKELEFQVRRFK